MALELRDCTFHGPALPEPFVKFQLERELNKRNLLAKTTGAEGRALEERWDVLRRKLRQLGEQGGDRRVANHVLEPLVERLGYSALERQAEVITREGAEDGGWLFTTAGGKRLRAWTVSLGTDLDAPNRRGRAYRFSPSRVAQRVLLASGERMGLLSDGEELRILLCDPARPDSHISIRLDRAGGWRAARALPDSYRLLLALASPAGVAALPDLTEAARLAQSSVTKKLRLQARRAIEGFLQEVLEHPANAQALADRSDRQQLAQQLWSEGLITVYRLLFVFKLESSADPARAFSFAATSLWRNTYSPNTALADLVRRVLDEGKESGGFLEAGLRTLWRMFAEGMSSSELEIKPLGGMLFGRDATPLLDQLQWGEQAVARLLDALLWTPGEGVSMRERVHYGALDVEDLGRVYESLLELEPGISTEPMCRLRRAKLEVVVPVAQGDPYRSNPAQTSDQEETGEDEEEGDEEEPALTRGRAASGSKTKVEFIEEIAADRFFLRVGLGRKASGSYYTPHPFVRFLVQETLRVLLAECSPRDNPQPALILKLKVLDAAMGSGHFLVEACRFLGEGLYEACRLCDELAVQAEEQAEKAEGVEREALLAQAAELRQRVEDLPDPNNELLAYLPSRAAEGEESGLSQKKAEAMCRRLVAVHCLYGVDKNPLAVELAKLSLWLESYAEGLPLTFLDHRLICGDSLTGPFFEHLLTYPKSGGRLDDLFAQGLTQRLEDTLAAALVHVRDLEASVGKDLADLNQKESAKKKLDLALAPLKTLAAAWAGGVMLGDECDDAGYKQLAEAVSLGCDRGDRYPQREGLIKMIGLGSAALPYQLVFPEVFYRTGDLPGGFDVVLGNPPWDAIQFKGKEFLAAFDLGILEAPTPKLRSLVEKRLLEDACVNNLLTGEQEAFEQLKRSNDKIFAYQKVIVEGDLAGRQLDAFRVFMERNAQLLREGGFTGVVVPSAFHANAGATGVRQLYLEKMDLQCCFSFENRKKLFDIDSRFKFAAVVARNSPSATSALRCGFYWQNLEDLFDPSSKLAYSSDFIRKTGGEYLAFLELRGQDHVDIIEKCFNSGILFVDWLSKANLRFRMTELHKSHDSRRFVKASELPLSASSSLYYAAIGLRCLVLHEGKTFHQYNDRWGPTPQFLVPLSGLSDRVDLLDITRYYRPAFREISSATNERTAIFTVLPPGSVTTHKAPSDQFPGQRCNAVALITVAVANSYCFDYLVRQRVQSSVSLFILKGTSWPALEDIKERFIAHSSLRLVSNCNDFEHLWLEQLGDLWRESTESHMYPVLQDEEARWIARAAIDALVADAYGLSREQYERLLSTFSHSSYPRAPSLCLEAFDELHEIGIQAYAKKHDPYWDIPLNNTLPQPVIDLAISGKGASSLGPLFDGGAAEAIVPAQLPIRTSASTAVPPNQHTGSATQSPSANGAFTTIAELLRSRGLITSSDAQQATGLDAAGVRPYLQQLVQQGLAVTEGQRRGMRYRRVDG